MFFIFITSFLEICLFHLAKQIHETPDKIAAHLPDLPLKVERIQAQRNYLPDWPSGKPTLVLPGLILEQVQAGQRHNIVMTKQLEWRTFRRKGAAETSTQKHV